MWFLLMRRIGHFRYTNGQPLALVVEANPEGDSAGQDQPNGRHLHSSFSKSSFLGPHQNC